jgi:hypothetical protein
VDRGASATLTHHRSLLSLSEKWWVGAADAAGSTLQTTAVPNELDDIIKAIQLYS